MDINLTFLRYAMRKEVQYQRVVFLISSPQRFLKSTSLPFFFLYLWKMVTLDKITGHLVARLQYGKS